MAGRPPSRASVIPEADIMEVDAIVDESWRLVTLAPEISTKIQTLEWLARRRLIKNEVLCATCQQPARLTAYVQGTDGYRWKCYRHNFTQSVRHGSFFTRSHLGLDKLVQLLYMWAMDFQQDQIMVELPIQENSRHTAIDWCNFIPEVCEEYLERNPKTVDGFHDDGTGIIVEIDESKYFHRKYHRGLWRPGHWVFGAIERHTGRCIMVEVPSRDQATLTPIIQEWIPPGSRIVSDGWAAYRGIDQIQGGVYEHDVVVHQRNFVDPDDPDIHTQNIENTWMRAKKKLRRQHGTTAQLFQSYLAEFLWRNRVRNNRFGGIMAAIIQIYPLN